KTAAAAGNFFSTIVPPQAARDHQVQYDEHIVIEREHDPLSHSFEARNAGARCGSERRLDAAPEERGSHSHALHPCSVQALFQRTDVSGDVGQLGHPAKLSWPYQTSQVPR